MNAAALQKVLETWREDATYKRIDLRGADLCAANLRGADLCAADLCDANLCAANLRGADLCAANLRGADLCAADLRGANLWGANLWGADLCDAIIPTGEKFGAYLSQTVPALLTAGGRSLKEVLSTGCWDFHDWSNCPTHAAFGASSLKEVPVLHRPRAEQFIQLFDSGLIPKPKI